MSREADRELIHVERRATLDLLESIAKLRGWNTNAGVERLSGEFHSPDGAIHAWPPRVHFRKSALPDLLASASILRSVATLPPARVTELPLPICVKLDLGAMGEGFRRIDDVALLRAVPALPSDVWVVQPLLQGDEYRVSLCRNGAYAAARLLERAGRISRWQDATDEIPTSWLPDLHAILEALALPIIGVDIMVVEPDRAHVLDVNAAPAIAIHLATTTPRDLSGAILDSWMAIDR